MLIRGKTFIVSGTVSGLGLAVARMLALEKANVLLIELNEEAWNAAQLSENTCFVRAEIVSQGEVPAAPDAAVREWGAQYGAKITDFCSTSTVNRIYN